MKKLARSSPTPVFSLSLSRTFQYRLKLACHEYFARQTPRKCNHVCYHLARCGGPLDAHAITPSINNGQTAARCPPYARLMMCVAACAIVAHQWKIHCNWRDVLVSCPVRWDWSFSVELMSEHRTPTFINQNSVHWQLTHHLFIWLLILSYCVSAWTPCGPTEVTDMSPAVPKVLLWDIFRIPA